MVCLVRWPQIEKKYALELTLKNRATLALFKKEDLVDALRDYPEDRALLARKAQKAAKEVAAKQAHGLFTSVISLCHPEIYFWFSL